MTMIIIIAGIATAINLMVIVAKFQKGDTTNGSLDLGVLALVMFVFQGSFAALSVGVIASAIFSGYLFAKPIKTDAFEGW